MEMIEDIYSKRIGRKPLSYGAPSHSALSHSAPSHTIRRAWLPV